MTSSFESNIQVGKKYQIQKKIGSGSFGDIYLGINMNNDDEEEVAIKMEPIKNNHAQLAREAKIYKSLHGIGRYYYQFQFYFIL